MTQNSPTYIVAVSGGVDSVVLLHMLMTRYEAVQSIARLNPKYVVAHVNHGIREGTSVRDQQFVRELALRYGLIFETIDLNLSPSASEEEARIARYTFFDNLISKYFANGVILAHHADDVMETAFINILRGTGRKGLSSLASTASKVRPLLNLHKQDIYNYARKYSLEWVEDETNDTPKYLRNRVRSHLAGVTAEQKATIAKHLQNINQTNTDLDEEIAKILQYKLKGNRSIISRSWFVKLPHDLACEVMRAILSRANTTNLDKHLIESLVIALKVARPGTKIDIDKKMYALCTKRSMRFTDRGSHRTVSIN